MAKRPASRRKVWVKAPERASNPPDEEKKAIVAACDALVRDVLMPRFLPEIRPTAFNYPVDLRGAWAGGRYRFIQRYRSGFADNEGEEFDAPFARIDRVGPDRFDVYWMRHTGQWWRLHTGLSLEKAFEILLTDERLHPV